VQPGDTLNRNRIQLRHDDLGDRQRQPAPKSDLVVIGTQLCIPTSVSSTTAYNPWQVRQLITSYSNTYGIDPALGLAISWQESGFNQNMISRTGAVGAMQVEP